MYKFPGICFLVFVPNMSWAQERQKLRKCELEAEIQFLKIQPNRMFTTKTWISIETQMNNFYWHNFCGICIPKVVLRSLDLKMWTENFLTVFISCTFSQKKNKEHTLVKHSSLTKQLDITEFQICPHMRFQFKLIINAQNI